MPRFTANLTMLWPELDVYDRFRAAAEAGFRRVEILFVHPLDPARVETLLREHRLELVLFDPAAGDWANGERGLLSVPGREKEFVQTVRDAVAAARRFGTRRLNALVGIPKGASPEEAHRTAVANLKAAAPLVEEIGGTLLVEAINSIDMPGYFADTVDKAAALVREANSKTVRLQLDQYHAGMMGADPVAALRKYGPLVAHAQVADVPGRNQPGTGKQPIAQFLEELDRMGYEGSVGLEYKPKGSMDEALAWLPRERRA